MGNRDFVLQESLAAFSFAEKGAKEKAFKKKTPLGGVSPSADGEEGFAPSTCVTFLKKGQSKTLNKGVTEIFCEAKAFFSLPLSVAFSPENKKCVKFSVLIDKYSKG